MVVFPWKYVVPAFAAGAFVSRRVDNDAPAPLDTTVPTVSTFGPTDAATDVAIGSNIVLTFNEAIARGTGNIQIRSGSATGTVVETFDAATSNRLSLSGSTLTIDPTNNLANSTQYFVTFASGAIKDVAGNNFAGTSTYDFITAALVTQDTCDIDFTFPDRPTGSTVRTLSVAALETEVQSFGDALDDAFELAEGESLVVDLGNLSSLSGATTSSGDSGGESFLVTASGNVGDLYFNAGNSASAQLVVDVSGGVGDISMRTGKDTESGMSVSVSAGGNVGHVTRFADGADAAGYLYIDTTGGDVARVDALFANPDGYGDLRVSAYAAVSGLSLVGGNVGDVSLVTEGVESEGNIHVWASGGDVGDVEIIACGGSASGRIYMSTFAQIDGNGMAVGGNIGDVTIVAHGGSADPEVYASAYGILSSSGQYLGGGNIGNVHVSTSVGSAEGDGYITSHSGGSIGNITLQTSSPGEDAYDSSANVNASVTGAGGQVATIGDVTMDVYSGHDNSASVYLRAYSGGDIGTITATSTGGASAHLDITASAYVNASGSGGNIGDVSLTDTSWAGDNGIHLYAEASIGDVTASVGDGSADIRMYVNAGEDAVVGNISVAFGDEHYGGGALFLGMASGATGANISVTGGSISSQFSIFANDINYGSEYEIGAKIGAKVAGDIDMSSFAGTSSVDLNSVEDGVSIDVGLGGSFVRGTLGADTITLGDGSDQISFNTDGGGSLTSGDTDTITGFDAHLADDTDAIDLFNIQSWGGVLVEMTSNDVISLTNNEAVSLVDLVDGDDLSTTVGLLAALNDGGEYALVDGVDGGRYTFATATGAAAKSFHLFYVEHESGLFSNAYLLADVSMATGSTFADLSVDNFIVV